MVELRYCNINWHKDHTPLDQFIWGYVKNKIYKTNQSISVINDEVIRIIGDIEPQRWTCVEQWLFILLFLYINAIYDTSIINKNISNQNKLWVSLKISKIT